MQVPLPLFWPGSCTTNIHKNGESTSSSIDHNLDRQHVNNRSNHKGGGVNQGHSHLPYATFRISSQFKEICVSTMSGNRISGPYCEFCESDSLTALAEGVHKDVQQELYIDFGIDQIFRPLVINHPSSRTSSINNSKSSTITDTVSEIEEVVSNECKIDSDRAKEELLWWMSKLQYSNGKLCIQNHLDQVLIQTDASKNGLGAVCKGLHTGGLQSKEEQLLYINVVELITIKIALLTIHFQIDNKTAIFNLLKMAGWRGGGGVWGGWVAEGTANQ